MSWPTAVRAVVLVALVATPAAADVSGTVVDGDGAPVAAARVSLEASGQHVLTDAGGGFTLLVPDGAVTVVAAARGFFHAALPVDAPAAGVVLTLAPVPLDDDPGYVFANPVSCGTCHPRQYAEWDESPMALAGANTWVYDLYDGSGTSGGDAGFVYTRDSMLADHNPASECASCHQPEPWAAAPFSAMAPLGAAAGRHGVSCEVCHRMADIDERKVNFPGLYPGVVRMARPSTFAPTQFGLLGDVAFSASAMRPSYQPQLAAAVCAACHQDKNDPDDDGDFEEDNGVISEPTYLEWLASSYADPDSPDHATCVDCHMAPTDQIAACTTYTPERPRPAGQLRSHRIEGTTAAYLAAAVTARIEASVDGDEVVVDVELENDRVGHHVPTGVTVRNMILLVEARRDDDGRVLAATGDQVVAELGGVGDPADGYYAGEPGKLYAKVPADAAGNAPVFFTEAASLASDNRIPAHGIDRTQYRFAVPDGGGAITVRARVLYRRAFRAVVDAKGWTTDGHGRPLGDLQAPDFGHLMAAAETTIDTVAPIAEDGGCGCQGSGGGGGGLSLLALGALAARRRLTPRPTRSTARSR